MWLSPTVFTWAPFVEASTEFKQEPWRRPDQRVSPFLQCLDLQEKPTVVCFA
jgi:hypothetical protein